METPAKQHLCRLAAPPAPSPPHRSGQGGRGAWTAGARGEVGHAGSRARGARTRGEPGRPGRTHPRDSSSVAGRASLAAAEPAGRAGKERPEPSGSLPWDTSCSALGPGRSPHLSGSLPRPPAEVCAGGDIRHPRPGRRGALRPASPRPGSARPGLGVRPGSLRAQRAAAAWTTRGPRGGRAPGAGERAGERRPAGALVLPKGPGGGSSGRCSPQPRLPRDCGRRERPSATPEPRPDTGSARGERKEVRPAPARCGPLHLRARL